MGGGKSSLVMGAIVGGGQWMDLQPLRTALHIISIISQNSFELKGSNSTNAHWALLVYFPF